MISRIFIIFLLTLLSANTMSNAMPSLSVEDSLSRAQRLLEQGQYYLAMDEVNTVIKSTPSEIQQSRADGMKGSLLLLMQHHGDAEKFLLRALESSTDELLKAGYANSLGVLYHDTGDTKRSKEYFETALALARNNPSLMLRIKLNRARSHPGSADLSQLEKLFTEIAAIDSATERTRYYLNLAKTAKSHGNRAYKLAQNALEKARLDVFNITNKFLQLELSNSLAELYEEQGLDQPALELSEQASRLPEQMNADDLMLQNEWRKGRIYQRQARDDHALAAFGKAVDHIQAIRMDIPVKYEDGKSSFRETMEPIFLDYAHQLLKKATNQKGESKQRTLRLARQAIEQIKQTELEDFLGGRCLIEGVQHNELENIDHQAAIIYPIILPDRLELLVGIGSTIRQYTQPISKEQISEQAIKLSKSLRTRPSDQNAEGYRLPAEALYQWIIAPVKKDLIENKIKTIVIVPDGVLRLVPFAALFDGAEFLVENYAIAISPGMSLLGMGSRNKKSQNYRTLLAGISKPGPVVKKLPEAVITAALLMNPRSTVQSESSRTRSILNTFSHFLSDITDEDEDENENKRTAVIHRLQEELSLPGVKAELESLKNTLKNNTLFNEQFTVKNFHQLVSDKPYEIIHIASHGFFSSDANSSFLMAYDDILKLDDFKILLEKNKNTGSIIQLLTLSACETAEGDDRAPLGFTGIALQANALSALGTLWPIDDTAAPHLMDQFYSRLMQDTGKAESLRQAQRALLKSPDMRHPYFWSPFILVGDWL